MLRSNPSQSSQSPHHVFDYILILLNLNVQVKNIAAQDISPVLKIFQDLLIIAVLYSHYHPFSTNYDRETFQLCKMSYEKIYTTRKKKGKAKK